MLKSLKIGQMVLFQLNDPFQPRQSLRSSHLCSMLPQLASQASPLLEIYPGHGHGLGQVLLSLD